MNVPLLNPGRASRVVVAAGFAAFLVAPAAPVGAAHRARLSADLADHLSAGSSSISVIVHGTKAEVDALASRYNLVVKRRMKSGAVLQVTAGAAQTTSRGTFRASRPSAPKPSANQARRGASASPLDLRLDASR